MRIIIFGGGGFLGSHLTKKLLAGQNEVTIFDLPSASYLEYSAKLGANIITGNFLDVYDVRKAITNKDILYFLISTTVPKTSNADPQYDIQTNVIGFINLLEEIRNLNEIKKIVFPSSGGTVYGIPEVIPITEAHPTNPICSYGIHKLTIEKYLQLYWTLYGLDYAILRIGNPYGERQPINGIQGVVGTFLDKAIKNEEIFIFGDGTITRDYIYAGDVANALYKAGYYKGSPKLFNIGSGTGQDLNEIIKTIKQVTNYALNIKYLPARPFDVPSNVLDISRAKKYLNWEPKTSFHKGMLRSYNYYLH
jgi:UDP-glucose 4-epimerase